MINKHNLLYKFWAAGLRRWRRSRSRSGCGVKLTTHLNLMPRS